MSVVPAGSKILVTGITGFIAAHVAEQLLAAGFRVRGTVRSLAKAEHLKQRFASYGDKIEFTVVEDLEKHGGFDEAVKGVAGIAHVASPFHFNVEDPWKDLINPAVQGTLSILEAAAVTEGIRRVVITSSFAAIAHPAEAGYKFTEEDWNDWALKEVEAKGKDVDAGVAYRASKSEAERKAWNFVKEKKPKFDVATINPVFVFGPIITDVPSPDAIPTSVGLLYKYFAGEHKSIGPSTPSMAFVDVRDVAKAHVEALVRPEAGGQRFLTAAGVFSWQEVADILREVYPDRPIPEGNPGKIRNGDETIVYGERANKVLGIDFIQLKQSVKDTAENLVQLEKKWAAR
ncbi:hypothetical protein SpCBS45565_g03123 [Spizellomyces sp. 'palustris']|nr:hypothetical protein SpCBS45565_g03123 [Spizellomyces sp. 'palustris']